MQRPARTGRQVKKHVDPQSSFSEGFLDGVDLLLDLRVVRPARSDIQILLSLPLPLLL